MISETNESSVLVYSTKTKPAYVLYPQRFYVLLVFSFLAFNQCLIWLTFSPVARSAEPYYGITEATIDLLLNWGPIIFIPCLPLTYILLNKHNGLRYCVILLSLLDLTAAMLRVIPIIITTPSSPHFTLISLVFLHAGQILNAACGPLVMAPVSQLSCLWFAPNERARATTIAILANNFGATVGFVISPYIVSSPDHVPYLLYLHVVLAFIPCVLALLYFPPHPPTPPSAAGELLIHNSVNAHNHSWKKHLKEIWMCLTNPSFVLIVFASCLISGGFSTWASLYDVILKPENYTQEQAGWFGFGESLAGNLGALFLSYLADSCGFHYSLKAFTLVSFIACLPVVMWFELSVSQSFFNRSILPSNAITMSLSTALAGLFASAPSTLVYEAVAEIMYPLPESLSASILVELYNLTVLIFLFIAPNRYKFINELVVIVNIVAVIMIMAARFTYTRRNEDERKRLEIEQSQAVYEENSNNYSSNIINESDYGTFSQNYK